MNLGKFATFIAFYVVAFLSLPAAQVFAVPITHFSSTTVQTFGDSIDFFNEIVINNNPLYIQTNSSTTGSTTNGSISYSNPSEGTASAQSQASLESGALRVQAESHSNANSGPFTNNVFAFARADIGDSFRTFDNQDPYQWASDTEVTFSIDFSGFVSTGPAVNNRANAGFSFIAFTPGFLDPYAQFLFNDAPFPTDFNANTIFSDNYHLGGTLYSFQTPVGPLPATIDVSFAPGGDFDWVAGITVDTAASLFDSSIADFFSTATMSYTGPAGTTTYSASGLFPGTLPLSNAPSSSVPEPGTLILMSLGLAAIGFIRRRRSV